MPTSPDYSADVATSDIVYAYKPSLMGAPFEFRLTRDALIWQKGNITGRTPYDRIRRIRMSYRPVTMQNYRFLTEIWPAEGPKLQIASTSWRGIMEQERFDEGYRVFTTELNRRVGVAGGTPLLQAGSPALLYWPGVIVLAGASLALAALIVRALQVESWAGAGFIAGFLALFIWQAGNFFRRNRPGTYHPDAVPDEVLPRG